MATLLASSADFVPFGAGDGDGALAELLNSVVGSAPLRKLPLLIANDLEKQLLRLGWPVGMKLGGEPALADRYGVGRDVLREAVRLLEARDHARMRRGPHGGLEIILPDIRELSARLAGYAYICGLDRVRIVETLALTQAAAVRLLMNKPGTDWSSLARSLASHNPLGARAIGKALIAATGSTLLTVLDDLFAALAPSFFDEPLADDTIRALREVRGADSLLHWIAAVELPDLLGGFQRHPGERRLPPPAGPGNTCCKGQAMQLVHHLMSTTSPERWRQGYLVGNEFDLADHFGVDKSVVRQAARLMEDTETATSLPGRGRGLITRLPTTAPFSRLLCAYLISHGVNAQDGEAVFAALSIECAGVAAERATSGDRCTLLAMLGDLDRLRAPVSVAALQGFERMQLCLTHNCLLSLAVDAIKVFLTWQMDHCPVAMRNVVETYCKYTREVGMAICSGDRESAISLQSMKIGALERVRSNQLRVMN